MGFRPGSTQVLGNDRPEFEKPATDRLIADRQSALSQEILDIPVAQGEPEVEADSVSDDIRRKSVVGIGNGLHGLICYHTRRTICR